MRTNRILLETILVITVTLQGMRFVPAAKTLFALVLVAYLLVERRLTPFIGIPAAIGIASLLFGLAHYAPGPGLVVFVDVGLIMVASFLSGLVFARCNNLWVVWLAHLLCDFMGCWRFPLV